MTFSKTAYIVEGFPQVSRFICFDLQIGCIFIGLVSIIVSTFGSGIAVVQLENVLKNADQVSRDKYQLALAYSALVLLGYMVTSLLSGLLIAGSIRDKARLLLPWIAWSCGQAVVYALLMLRTTFYAQLHHQTTTAFYTLIVGIMISGVRIYCISVVANYYRKITSATLIILSNKYQSLQQDTSVTKPVQDV